MGRILDGKILSTYNDNIHLFLFDLGVRTATPTYNLERFDILFSNNMNFKEGVISLR